MFIPADKFCVYAHHVDGVCIYIGMGRPHRPFTRFHRRGKWFEFTKHGFNVEILSWHETKSAAREEETRLIKQLKPVCNSLHTGRPGRKHTAQDKAEMSKRLKERWKNNPNMRAGSVKARVAIRCVETGIVYPSLFQTSKETGFCPSHISQVINGRVPHAGGYHFIREE